MQRPEHPSSASGLAQEIRIAAALAHALPGTRLELENADGEVLLVGFGVDCCWSPCEFRHEVLDADLHGGLPHGTVGVRLRDAPPAICHTGLGLYRYQSDAAYGFACATTLRPDRVEDVLRTALADEPVGSPLRGEPFHTISDEDLGVTLLYTRHDEETFGGLVDEAERRAQRAVIACLSAEFVDDALGTP